MKICVFGAASDQIDKSYIEAGEKLGEELAKRGHELVFGAGGNGLMGAVGRGVHRMGGKIYGIIPSFFKDESIEMIFDKCDELIYTETMAERKSLMDDMSDAFITVPGGIGTFEEFFQMMTLKQLGRHTKPMVLYDINGYYEELEAFLKISVAERFIREDCKMLYKYSTDEKEVFDYIEHDKRIKKDVHDLKLG